ncbi:MAG: PQQ-binding-like beta-propeller repeat protein [Dehalococcoidia bacterium]|nr:PQQ-binding-like beta-propeller repeat protein [Dehalococcoidia bacterium]
MKFTGKNQYIFITIMLIILVVSVSCRTAPARGWSGPAAVDGTIYTGTIAGKVAAYKGSNGDPEWQTTLPTPATSIGFGCGGPAPKAAIYSHPVSDGKSIFLGTYEGVFYALDTTSGALRWQYPATGRGKAIIGSAAVYNGNVYFGSSDGYIYSLNANNGLLREKYLLGKKIWSTPTVVDDRLYIGSFDGKLYAFDLKKGLKEESLLWTFSSNGAITAGPLIANDTIYIGSFDSHLYALDKNSGRVKWSFKGSGWFWEAPVIKDNLLVAVNVKKDSEPDKNVYGINALTGQKIWEFGTQGSVRASPVISGNTVIVASEDNNIYFLQSNTGSQIRLIPMNSPVLSNMTVDAGFVYVHTREGLLSAIDIEKGTRVWEVSTYPKEK